MSIVDKSGLVVVAALVTFAAGCTSTQTDKLTVPEKQPVALNQPKIDKLVVIGDAQTEVSNSHIDVKENRVKSPMSNDSEVAKANTKNSLKTIKSIPSAEKVPTYSPISPALTPSYPVVNTSIDASTTHTFTLLAGETYQDAIYRWLGSLGYKQVGFLISDSYQKKLSQNIDSDLVLTTSFDDAITHLHNIVVKLDPNKDDEYEYSDKNKGTQKAEKLQVKLIGKDKAIVTTSLLPVTLFEVQRGSLKGNYLRLGKAYGWSVSDEFFLSDDYKVPFDFLIVTEKENVKKALSKLLEPFPGLIGGKYNDKHQLFVMTEDNK